VAILEKVILQDVLSMTEHTLAAGQGVAYIKDHEEAIAIGPGFEPNKRSDAPIELRDIAAQVA